MTDNTEVVEATEEVKVEITETEVEKPWFGNLGYESEDAFRADFESMQGLKSRAAEIDTRDLDLKAKMEILQSVEEDPDVEIAQLAALKKKGIPVSIATQAIAATVEELEANPLSTLILAEAVANPSKYQKLGKAGTEAAIREKYSLGDDSDYTPTALMKSDAIDAIERINKIKGDIGEVKNPYLIAKENRENSARAHIERQTQATTEVQSVVKGLKEVAYKFGDSSVSLQVSKEEIDSLLASDGAKALGYFYDPSTKEGKAAIKDWVNAQILGHKFQSGEVGQKIAESVSQQAKKEAIKEVHNGGTVVLDRSGKQPANDKDLTPTQRDLLSRGITPPSLAGKS